MSDSLNQRFKCMFGLNGEVSVLTIIGPEDDNLCVIPNFIALITSPAEYRTVQ